MSFTTNYIEKKKKTLCCKKKKKKKTPFIALASEVAKKKSYFNTPIYNSPTSDVLLFHTTH